MSRFPPACVQAISFFHLTTTGGETQDYEAGDTVSGAVLPLDRRDLALEGVDLNEPWELYLDPDVDVRLNDKVSISKDSSSNYYVRHIFSAQFGGLAHLRVVISKQP